MTRWTVLLGLSLTACDAPPSVPPDAGAPAHRCAGSVAGPVGTIAQAVERLHALPPPVTVPCFVASLPRPLSVVATSGVISAQPASGAENPRLFLFSGELVLSVVGGGAGRDLIEFGEWVTPTRTLKGEVALPRDGGALELEPFERVLHQPGMTTCALCHRTEERSATVDGGYVSAAYQPERGTEVPLATVRGLRDACVAAGDESPRCELYRAVFDVGEVTQGAFGKDVERFLP